MHMADALLSPAVGTTMLVASAAAIGLSVKKISGNNFDEKKIPLMGVMGAFIFAGQMINFTIPGTGSSGHIGGGILLAAILGPFPALLALASVLLIQCLFFADGGLLAYGCNVFNMGVTSCLITYTLIYKPIIKNGVNKKNITIASILSVIAGLQLGAFFVVLETLASGITELPFKTFVLLMQPIHLAIGLVEGIVTAAVLCFLHSARPEILAAQSTGKQMSFKKVIAIFAVLALLIGGGLSLLASAFPDGLEWAIENTAGTTELEAEGPLFNAATSAVEKTAFLPDYDFKDAEGPGGTTISGIVGSLITLAVALGVGTLIFLCKRLGHLKKV
ncbi:MAG: energy-coupling factor ABC transporter permease [Termitinemataceae bacterium]|nr:MAG: energy-coupling factor ABC transporter permease [Termitinemataceae bacterium]